MAERHRLRDTFNGKSLRNAVLATVAAASVAACGVIPARSQELPKSPTACVADTTPAAPQQIPYDEELLRANDDAPPPPSLVAMDDEQRFQYYRGKLCFAAQDWESDSNPRDQYIVSTLNRLRASPGLGRPLLDMAAARHLDFCATPKMPAGVAEQYLAGHRLVVAGLNDDEAGQTLDIAHELTHAAQDSLLVLQYFYSWDIESRARHNLAIEAAPVALEYALAYEQKLAGDDRYWDYIAKTTGHFGYANPDNLRLFETTYRRAAAGGAGEAAALRAGAHAVFESVFAIPSWRDFYLDSELNSYLEDMAAGNLTGLPVAASGFGQADVDRAGRIGDLPSFTRGARVPALAELLAGNQKMRWAFDAVDLARVKLAEGAASPAAQALEAKLQKEKNPYAGLDMTEVSRRAHAAQWGGSFKYTYEIMDKMRTEKFSPAAPRPCVVAPAPKAGS